PSGGIQPDILAKNEAGSAVSMSRRVESGRITFAPRGMLAGDLEDLNDLIRESRSWSFRRMSRSIASERLSPKRKRRRGGHRRGSGVDEDSPVPLSRTRSRRSS